MARDKGKRRTWYARTRIEVAAKLKAAHQAISAFVGLRELVQRRASVLATEALWHV